MATSSVGKGPKKGLKWTVQSAISSVEKGRTKQKKKQVYYTEKSEKTKSANDGARCGKTLRNQNKTC